ncbi:hypothetical protein KUTeg_022462 [Tegillarca granosa]|uniref:Uncharacterized protein n=1 Tax=Tegillarca granosa TaxID=220873 RepID=A0ABQ9ECF3_TEGGR|nr:hypothetical protein KUTeg_022462 [Tegillarca granosa]
MASTSKADEAPPQPANPNDFPPPSYEEVMGHQTQSSINKSVQQELPPLAYTDIMPHCLNPGNIKEKIMPQFDKFSALIQAANHWLRANPDLAVWKCETVERKCDEGPTIQMDKMTYHQSTFGFNVYVRGLRLWLTKNPNPNAPPQQLGLLHKVPETVHIPVSYGRRGMVIINPMSMGVMDDPFFKGMMMKSYTTFEGLKETICRLNEDLKKNPLQGTILNVEAAMHKSCEGLGGSINLDPDITVWAEEGSKMKRFTQIIRVFYIIGQPAHEQIGLQQFEPDIAKKGDLSRPTIFQPMSTLMQRVAMWIPHQTGIRVVNIQTHDAMYKEVLELAYQSLYFFSNSENVQLMKQSGKKGGAGFVGFLRKSKSEDLKEYKIHEM